MNTDLKHYAAFVFFQGARIVFSMLSMAILARYIGPDGLGRWALVTAAATLLHLFMANWLQQDAFLRFGKQEWSKHGTVSRTWAARMPLLIAGIVIAGILLKTTPTIWQKSLFELTGHEVGLAFGFFLCLLIGVECQTFLQITGRMVRLAMGPALIAIALAVFYTILWFSSIPEHHFEISLAGTILLTMGVWLGTLVPDLKRLRLSPWDSKLMKDILLFAWPILPTTLLGYTVNWGNQVLIQHFFTSRDVGLYQSAFQIHSLVVTLAVPFTTIILPRLLDRHIEDSTVMKRYVTDIAPTLFCLWVLAMIPLISVLPFAFRWIYGRMFIESIPTLTALLGGTLFCALGQIYTVLYTVQGKLGKLLWILVSMVAINMSLAWIIPSPSQITIRSIAIAFSLGFIIAQVLTFYYQHWTLEGQGAKMFALLCGAVVFSAGETQIYSLGYRVVWGLASLALVIGITRQTRTIDGAILDRLFIGRLETAGKLLKWAVVR